MFFGTCPQSVRLPTYVGENLVRTKVDAILGIGTLGITAAALTTRTIPIVAVDLESDPIAQKLAVSLARPGGNVTGMFLAFPELSGKIRHEIVEPSQLEVPVRSDAKSAGSAIDPHNAKSPAAMAGLSARLATKFGGSSTWDRTRDLRVIK
jgi:hypothetical protein